MRQQTSNNEQMSISIRYVDTKYDIHEETVGLIQLPNTTQTLFAVLKDVLLRCSLPITQCVGQAYDGAANMSGIRQGVPALMKRECGRARILCSLLCPQFVPVLAVKSYEMLKLYSS